MNDPISLSRMRDPAFTAEVERQSGQNLATCYQCGNCTAGCPAGPIAYDTQVNQIIATAIASALAAYITSAQADTLYKPIFNANTHTMIFPAANFNDDPEPGPSSSEI